LKFAGSCRVSATFLLGIAKPGWAEDEEVREEGGRERSWSWVAVSAKKKRTRVEFQRC